MRETLRFGLVGCGMIGPLHAEAITSLPDAELHAVTDIVLERAEKLAHGAGEASSLSPALGAERALDSLSSSLDRLPSLSTSHPHYLAPRREALRTS